MLINNYTLCFIVLSLFVGATPASAKKKLQLTPLEMQAIQSKEFETSKDILFASVMSVLQDAGYQIDNADLQTGFISATSASTGKTNFWEAMGGASASGNTRATAFVERLTGKAARVRLNFLNTRMTSFGYGQQSRNDRPVLDPQIYRNAWEKIDEAIFIRQSTEDPSPNKEGDNLVVPAQAPQN